MARDRGRNRPAYAGTPLDGARVKKVAIIGAGAAGLCGARHMQAAGFDVTIFEIGTQIGGMWVYKNDNGRSSAYKTS